MAVWDDPLFHVPYLITLIEVVVVAVVAIILERVLARYVRRFVKSRELPPDVGNGLVPFFRLLMRAHACIKP